MGGARIHFEVFVRRRAGGPWNLELATEDRGHAIGVAHELRDIRRAHGVKVTKETLDAASREFRTVTILALGDAGDGAREKPAPPVEPLCTAPQDLYSVHARGRIGRVLEDWLDQAGVTPFELLHRPDLVDQLEAAEGVMQHAIQKIAVPEAQARGASVHELIRAFHGLIERTIERLMRESRRNFPDLAREGFATAARRLQAAPDGAFLLGGGVAALLRNADGWSGKVLKLMDLADAAPADPGARRFALSVLEQPLAEILEAKPGLDHLVGEDLDLGASLAAMTRLAAGKAVDMLVRLEPSVAKVMPEPSPPAARLARWLAEEDFADLRTALGKRILRDLNGPRRLRPGDATGEIAVLRGLAMCLTAAAGKHLPMDDVQSAFSARSRMLVTSDFVEAYLPPGRTAREEAAALVWLTENVIGASNKRQAGRWLSSVVYSLRFEREAIASDEPPTARLVALATLQREAGRCGLPPEDAEPIQACIGLVGGQIEANARLTATLARAKAPQLQKLSLLLKLAGGESAPFGPAAERARDEALKLMRGADIRQALAAAPDKVAPMRALMQQAGLAA